MNANQSRTRRIALVLLALAVVVPACDVFAQARDTVASLRTRYNTVKTQAAPQGELKGKFDALDEQIVRAARLGHTGEMRRLFTRGIALSAGREWTPELDFANSLALRTEKVFVDAARPISFRLEQIYAPAIELSAPLTLRVTLFKSSAAVPLGEKLRDAIAFEEVSRDLGDNPFRFDLDLNGVADGRIMVRAEVFDGGRSLGAATLALEVCKGLDERFTRLESDAAALKGLDAFLPEVRYPADYVRNVDRGRIAIGQFNLERELALADGALAQLKTGHDPLASRTGDFKRHYWHEEAGEIMPYRIYVPTTYNASRAMPLIILLHGNGGTENSFFDGYESRMPRLAEERGYIVAAPMGYRVDGGYGYNNNGSRPAEDMRKLQLSEKDVMHVLELMKRDYKIDSNRIYVAGHSMGGFGAWYLGSRYTDMWAALGTFAGGGTEATLAQMKNLPQFVVHGDADATVSVQRSRAMVAEIKKLGIVHQYIEVPGGTHGSIVAPNLKAMFDFFDQHRKAGAK